MTHLDSIDSVSKELKGRKKKSDNKVSQIWEQNSATNKRHHKLLSIFNLKPACSSNSPAAFRFWHWRKMADVEEIQEYLWEDLIFHNYSLRNKNKRRFRWARHTGKLRHIARSWQCQLGTEFLLDERTQNVDQPADRAPGLASSAPELWGPSFWHASKGFQEVLCFFSAEKVFKNIKLKNIYFLIKNVYTVSHKYSKCNLLS